jgi:putative transposase
VDILHLYVVLNVYSRYVASWRLESRESATLATELFIDMIAKEHLEPKLLTVHRDGGTSMTSKTLTQLFADIGVVKSRSRPHVSDWSGPRLDRTRGIA